MCSSLVPDFLPHFTTSNCHRSTLEIGILPPVPPYNSRCSKRKMWRVHTYYYNTHFFPLHHHGGYSLKMMITARAALVTLALTSIATIRSTIAEEFCFGVWGDMPCAYIRLWLCFWSQCLFILRPVFSAISVHTAVFTVYYYIIHRCLACGIEGNNRLTVFTTDKKRWSL